VDTSRQTQRQEVGALTRQVDLTLIERRLGDRRLNKPARFDPPMLIDRGRRNDDQSRQLAAATENARQEGLRAAQREIAAVVAAHNRTREQLEAATRSLASAVDQVAQRDAGELEALQHQAVLFGIALCEELIGRELSSCDDATAAAIERAMRLVPDRGTVYLRVHPAAIAAAGDVVAANAGLRGRAELVADSQVEAGGCIAVVGPLRIDAQIGPALERVRKAVGDLDNDLLEFSGVSAQSPS
jgi:flagellar biosynthesis/type III secretory pathway protein FliH